MKKKYLKILTIIVLFIVPLLGIMGVKKQIAVDVVDVESVYNDFTSKLKKYEMVFVYPKEKKTEIEKIEEELKQIYNLAHDKLIVNHMEYDKSDCKNSIIADIKLKGDVSYRSLVFVYTNSNMCNHIQFAMQNTTSSLSKHKEGIARQKIITIPTDEQAKKSLQNWNKGREDWLNYKYTNNTNEAIDEMYTTLDISKEEVRDANKNQSQNNTNNQTNNNTKNKTENVLEFANQDIKIKHKVQTVQIVLSNGMIVNPDNINGNEEIKTVDLDSSTVHGAKVYIQYNISVEKINKDKNIDISEITVKSSNNKLTYKDDTVLLDENKTNKSQGWIEENDGTLTNTIQIGQTIKLVEYQVITNGMDLIYENEITDAKYNRTTLTINPDGTNSQKTETIAIPNIIKSDTIKLEEN